MVSSISSIHGKSDERTSADEPLDEVGEALLRNDVQERVDRVHRARLLHKLLLCGLQKVERVALKLALLLVRQEALEALGPVDVDAVLLDPALDSRDLADPRRAEHVAAQDLARVHELRRRERLADLVRGFLRAALVCEGFLARRVCDFRRGGSATFS